MRRWFRYFNPDDWYEALLDSLVSENTRWLDVGSGRDIFPSNQKLARELADRCQLLVGVDPDPNIHENEYVDEQHCSTIEEFRHPNEFDLISLRMVAEHIEDPSTAMSAIAQNASTGAHIVIYTVNKYSPAPIITRLTPYRIRHVIKHFLWRTEERDTFPTTFLLNSRRDIGRVMSEHDMDEVLFMRLDDCRSLARWRVTLFLELLVRSFLHVLRIPYPENCILTVYRKR